MSRKHQREWNTDLFDCSEDTCSDICCSCLCPSGTSAKARTINDGSSKCFNSCCVSMPALRNIIQKENNIRGSCIGDICVSFWCPCCTARQMINDAKVTKEARINGPGRQTM